MDADQWLANQASPLVKAAYAVRAMTLADYGPVHRLWRETEGVALGAESGRLWRDFTRGHFATALIGVAIGLIGASQAVRVLGAMLYGVDPRSTATYASVAFTILFVAALACIPSLFRLKRINPADCLRSL